jgi:MurNAc alpha-1-phosphate uridylyltransferase
MMPLTDSVAKSMIRINGETLISKSIVQIKNIIPNIGITIGHMGAELAKHVVEHDVSMIFNTSGKGNAWWIFNTLMKLLDEPVLVLTCDNIVTLDIEFIYSNYLSLGEPACMIVPVKPVTGIEGDFITGNDHKVTALDRNTPAETYCSGIQVLNPLTVNKKIAAADNFYDLWHQLIATGNLYHSDTYPHQWYSINSIEQLRGYLPAIAG